MIEDEVLAFVSSLDRGRRLQSFTDQFRSGRDAKDLLMLLYSKDVELIRIGCFVVNEISFDSYNAPDFISRLRELTEHQIPVIRLYAIGALYPTFDREDLDTRMLIERMLRDPNEGVRSSAQAAAKRLSLF